MGSRPFFRQKYNRDVSEQFYFRRPPEAPVFEPTMEEFQDPIAWVLLSQQFIFLLIVMANEQNIRCNVYLSGSRCPFLLVTNLG